MARARANETVKKLKVLGRVLRHTGADKIIAGFIGFLLLCSVIIWIKKGTVTITATSANGKTATTKVKVK